MESEVVTKLKQIAADAGYKISLTEEADGTYIDCVIENGDVDLAVAIPKHDGEFYAYDIQSTGLPLEVYSDELSEGFSEQARSSEILDNVDKILNKKIEFHPKPRVLNGDAGYIVLPIDGKSVKLRQKRNSFGLRLSN